MVLEKQNIKYRIFDKQNDENKREIYISIKKFKL
jgi:hypothetical protein